MTPIRETIAKAVSGAPFPTARSLGKADAVLRALDEAGLVVVPKDASEAMVLAITGDAWNAVYEMGRTSERISGGAAHITGADARRLARAVIAAAKEPG